MEQNKDDGKERGKDSGTNRDEDVEENKRSHNEGQSEKLKHLKGVKGGYYINEKVREIRMRWYGHVMSMEEANPVKNMMNMEKLEIEGTRPRGRPGKRWKDNVMKDMDHFQVRAKDTEARQLRQLWRRKTADPVVLNQASGREREKERKEKKCNYHFSLYNGKLSIRTFFI